MNVCPQCQARQDAGLLCSSCCDVLERELASVRDLMTELDVSISKMARLPAGGGGRRNKLDKDDEPGLSPIASTRWPINLGASAAAWDIEQTLIKWERDVCPALLPSSPRSIPIIPAIAASKRLLLHVNEIRRHPKVPQLVEEISDVIRKGRRAIDRPMERVYVGPCMVVNDNDVTCLADIFARPNAPHAVCKACGITHDVAERRIWLLEQARDRLFTVKEAAQMVGDVGRIRVTEDRIRGYLRRGRLAYHPIGDKARGIRLGDLLTIVIDDSEKRGAA